MRDLSSTKVHLKGIPSMPPKLISGRWLLSCESGRRFVLYDVCAGAETLAHQVLWEEEKPVVSSWDMRWMTSVEGRCVVYVVVQFFKKYRKGNSPKWYVCVCPLIRSFCGGHLIWTCVHSSSHRQLLEFRLNDWSGELYDSAVIDPPESTLLRVELHGGRSPFFYIMADQACMVFDTRTRVFYELPKFRIALVRVGLYE